MAECQRLEREGCPARGRQSEHTPLDRAEPRVGVAAATLQSASRPGTSQAVRVQWMADVLRLANLADGLVAAIVRFPAFSSRHRTQKGRAQRRLRQRRAIREASFSYKCVNTHSLFAAHTLHSRSWNKALDSQSSFHGLLSECCHGAARQLPFRRAKEAFARDLVAAQTHADTSGASAWVALRSKTALTCPVCPLNCDFARRCRHSVARCCR